MKRNTKTKGKTTRSKKAARHAELQRLCRMYLGKLMHMAKKHKLDGFVRKTIWDNKRERCEGTEYEVQMLARMANDERIHRAAIPKMLGKSYRQCFEDEDFEQVKKLPYLGIYSKVNALLYKAEKGV